MKFATDEEVRDRVKVLDARARIYASLRKMGYSDKEARKKIKELELFGF